MTREDAWKTPATNTTGIDESLAYRIADDVYGSRYQFLKDEALLRVTEANEFFRYYNLEGQYWNPPTMGYSPTVMPINLARWFIKRRASWMFEVAPDVECPPEQYDDSEEMATTGYKPSKKQARLNDQAAAREQMLYDIWGENKLDEKMLASVKDYFISGTIALKMRYLPNIGIRAQFCPGQEVFPLPNQDEPDKFDKIHFCSYFDNINTVWKQTWELFRGKCYLTEGTYDASSLLPNSGGLTYDRVDTGLDFIPVILFPHQALSGEMFGRSYLSDLVPLMDQYNRTMSDAADSLRFNLFAVTIMLNAPPDAEKMVKLAPQEIWNVGGDGVDVKKLESSFNYSNALNEFLTRLENLMHLLGDVPDITPDRIKGFGLVSGVALKLLYSDLLSATQQDWRVWKSRLVEMDERFLQMLEIYRGTEGFPYGDMPIDKIARNYDNRVIPHLPLPENEMEKIQMESMKLKDSMQSVKGALTEIGERYPDRKIAEIITEREKFLPAGESVGKQINTGEQETITGA